MKKLVCLFLCLSLAAGLTVPALADMEGALGNITQQVKETLLVDDEYTQFSGNYQDGLKPAWNLYWSDDERSLSVVCDENGKVFDAYRWSNAGDNDQYYGFDAAFPAMSREEAQKEAEVWLGRLMGAGETGRIDNMSVSLTSDGAYAFVGTVLINGLDSPITFRLSMDEAGLLNYYRSDEYSGYVGEIPVSEADVSGESAGEKLADAVKLELYYVSDGQGNAKLRYVPAWAYTVVDAASGDAVDMDALYESFSGSGYATSTMDAAAEDAGAFRASGLTEVELDSIGNYGDAMGEELLDETLRGIKQLGLADFALERCSYSLDSATGDITADLRYTADMSGDALYGYTLASYQDYSSWCDSATIYKYISVNAKTGAILSVNTNYPLWEQDKAAAQDSETLQAAAESYLEAAASEMYAASALCTLNAYADGESYTYAQWEQGYFFPENSITLRLNTATGTVDEYYYTWDNDITFADPSGIVGMDEAIASYLDGLALTLGYVAWPEGVRDDDIVYQKYMDWGYTWVESLRLAYYYDGLSEVTGVDAATGTVITAPATADGAYVYDDLENNAQREIIEALGDAGVGFAGGSFQPEKTIMQREALTLLLQSAGYNTADWTEDSMREQALYLGFISADQWQPEEAVTRGTFMRMIIGASRYGAAAELTGIWDTSFSDVSAQEEGYAAIAQALGMVSGDALNADELCTRAEAAVMLYSFMSRS